MNETHKATLSFHGGVGSVTGANFFLEGDTTKVLIDCGLLQGERFATKANCELFPYVPAHINYVLITHAHIDHIGRLPKLVRDGFHGKIISTPETKELSAFMLADALLVMRTESEEGEEPCYNEKDIARALSLWETFSYHESFVLRDEFNVVFRDAGHILGSAMIEIVSSLRDGGVRDRKIVFTGDLGNSPSPLLRDTEEIVQATYLVMESVYGDRNHEGRERRREELARVINELAERGGVLLIPSFSLEKTQELLYEIDNLLAAKKIPSLPTFLDSPLAVRVTEVYRSHSAQFNAAVRQKIERGDDIFAFPRLKLTVNARSSAAIAEEATPRVIIAGSGMSTGGRIVGHERRYLSSPQNTILFVGYQAAGSLGRMIQEGIKNVRIGEDDIDVRAKVETITGYSSHKDSNHLVDFVEHAAQGGKLERVFVVMGEPKASLFLAQRIKDYVGVEAVVPEMGEKVTLEM